ncbi:hypothetical protein [Indioceanicola profundi]|uniref:hypothetical protein n=1 Tax=Indioceanicola profundi TaxID=2220096 RepID=UPI0013C45EFE|nr:hypothetical protein [Indioceanicola profundi]
MARISLMNGLRIIVALAVMAGILSFGSHSVSAHGLGPTLAVAAWEMDVTDGHHHGHAHDHDHDHDADAERRPGHVHGHNPVDHSHVMIGLAMENVASACSRTASWPVGPLLLPHSAPLYLPERPPRSGTWM